MHLYTMRPTGRPHAVILVIAALVLAACGGGADEETGSSPGDADPVEEPTPDTEDETDDAGEGDAPADAEDESATDPDGDATADPATDEGSSGEEVASMAFTDCAGDRYTVGYPQGWSTNSDEGLLGPCEIFHPGEIEVPENPRDRDLHYAVSMYVDDVDFEDRVGSDDPNEVLSERQTTVAGRSALVVEYRSTGSGLVPEGERSYSWSVDLDGELLVATTSSVGETDYERDKRVLDRMVADELQIHEASEG